MTTLTKQQRSAATYFKAEGFTVIDHATRREIQVIRNAAAKLNRFASAAYLPNGRILVGPVGVLLTNSVLWLAVRKLFQNWSLFINLVNSTDERPDDQPHDTDRKDANRCELKAIVEKMAWILRKFPELIRVFESVSWGYQDARRLIFTEMERQDEIKRLIVEAGFKPEVLMKGHLYAVGYVRACNPVTRLGMAGELRTQVPGLEESFFPDRNQASKLLARIVISNLEAAGLVTVEEIPNCGQCVDFPAAHYYEATREKSEARMVRFVMTGVR